MSHQPARLLKNIPYEKCSEGCQKIGQKYKKIFNELIGS
jgi:hypothetical protein